jgi:hypothetical protein
MFTWPRCVGFWRESCTTDCAGERIRLRQAEEAETMARHIFAACGALAIAGVALSAQSTTPAPSSPPSQPSAAAGTVTVQGCLKPASGAMGGATTTGTPGTTGTTGTAGATGAGAAGAQFILTDAKPAAGSGSPTAGTSGSSATANEYQLRAEGTSVNLSQHVNHQVELTGRVASASSSSAPSAATPPSATAAGASKPTLTVTSLKMIAAECK